MINSTMLPADSKRFSFIVEPYDTWQENLQALKEFQPNDFRRKVKMNVAPKDRYRIAFVGT